MMITVVPVGKIDEEYLDVAAEALRENIPNALVDIHEDILSIPRGRVFINKRSV